MGLATSIIGGISAEKAANVQADAARDAQGTATAEQRRQFDLARSDSAPWRAAGASALDKLSRLYGLNTQSQTQTPEYTPESYDPATNSFSFRKSLQPGPSAESKPDMSVFQESPDYQFNLAEGQRALNNSLVARGRGLSGAAVKAGVRYASGAASQQFGDFYNRLAGIAGVGQIANQNSAALGANVANQVGQYAQNAGQTIGNARASAYQSIAANQAKESANAQQIAGYFLGKK